MSDTLIKVDNVSKKFCRSLKKSLWYGMQDLGRELAGRPHGGGGQLRPDEFWAVKDVSFEVKRGECLGLIGRNGAGKTTLLKMLNGLVKPDAGRIEIRGRVGALIALGAGFNPVLTGRENVYVNASVLGLKKSEIDAKFDEIVEFAELEEFIDSPVQSYSSGMVVRLGFSIATTARPPVLILDEVLAVGDIAFRDKCYQRIGELLGNTAVVMVSHDMNSLYRLTNAVLLLHKGQLVEHGPANKVLPTYVMSSKGEVPVVKVTTAPWINNFKIDASQHPSGKGDMFDLVVRISFTSHYETPIVQALGNITGNAGAGPLAGQFDFQPMLNRLSRGNNSVSFRLPKLSLAEGSYTCTVVVFCGDGKELAFSARDFLFFSLSGNARFGAFYAPRCELIEPEQEYM